MFLNKTFDVIYGGKYKVFAKRDGIKPVKNPAIFHIGINLLHIFSEFLQSFLNVQILFLDDF